MRGDPPDAVDAKSHVATILDDEDGGTYVGLVGIYKTFTHFRSSMALPSRSTVASSAERRHMRGS